MPQPRKLHDEYFKRAKAEGYAARSAYKLLEIHEKRRRLLWKGARVLDLGCAPGSWLQVAEKKVGPEGRVVGVDLQMVDIPLGPTVTTVVGDVFGLEGKTYLELGGGRFDVVLSDMAPNTTGHGDDFMSVRLCRRVLELLPVVIAPGGWCVMKVLEGEEFPKLLRQTAALFKETGATKPAASRDVSREMFIVARGYRGPRLDEPQPTRAPMGRMPTPREGWKS